MTFKVYHLLLAGICALMTVYALANDEFWVALFGVGTTGFNTFCAARHRADELWGK